MDGFSLDSVPDSETDHDHNTVIQHIRQSMKSNANKLLEADRKRKLKESKGKEASGK